MLGLKAFRITDSSKYRTNINGLLISVTNPTKTKEEITISRFELEDMVGTPNRRKTL